MKKLIAIFVLLTAAPTLAASKPPRVFNSVGQPPILLVPVADKVIEPGKDLVLGKGQQFARYMVARKPDATLAITRRIAISGFAVEAPAGAVLKPAVADFTMAGRIAEKAAIYCAFKQASIPGWMLPLTTAFGKEVRFCLADSDGDLKFDRMFLANGKKAADTAVVPLEPLGFAVAGPPKESREFVWFSFERYIPLFVRPGFKLRLEQDGKVHEAGIFNLQSGNKMLSYTHYPVNGYPGGYFSYFPPNILPFPMALGNLRFHVIAMDKVADTITIRLDAPAQPMIAEVATLEDLPISYADRAPDRAPKTEVR